MGRGRGSPVPGRGCLLASTSDLSFTGNSETNYDATFLLQPSKKNINKKFCLILFFRIWL